MDEKKYDQPFDGFQDFNSMGEYEIDLSDAILMTYIDNGTNEYRMDTVWYLLQEMKSSVGNNYGFHNLCEVGKIVLITPYSNTGIERVYSLVNKNKSEGSERNRLDIDGSLSSIVAAKLGRPKSSFKYYNSIPSEVQMKRTTKEYNVAVSSIIIFL